MKFAKRTEWNLESNQLSVLLEERKESGRPLIDLTQSNPTACGFEYPPDFLENLSDNGNFSYSPSAAGLSEAREAVCRYYQIKGVDLDPGQIFLTASTSEAYSFLFRLLCDPGDSVAFPAPSYPLFEFLVSINDLKTHYYFWEYQNRWRISPGAFADLEARDLSACVLVNPNNPTGSFYTLDEISRFNTLARSRNFSLICDEVFHDFALGPEDFPSLAGNREALTFTFNGLSKTLALPQMKLSWIVVSGPQDEVREALRRLEMIADTYLSVNTPVQRALPRWLERQKDIQEPVKRRIRANARWLKENFSDECGEVLDVQAGWCAVLRLPAGVDEEEFVLDLLRRKGVLAHPGFFFEFQRAPYLVVSLLVPEERFREGISLLLAQIRERAQNTC